MVYLVAFSNQFICKNFIKDFLSYNSGLFELKSHKSGLILIEKKKKSEVRYKVDILTCNCEIKSLNYLFYFYLFIGGNKQKNNKKDRTAICKLKL